MHLSLIDPFIPFKKFEVLFGFCIRTWYLYQINECIFIFKSNDSLIDLFYRFNLWLLLLNYLIQHKKCWQVYYISTHPNLWTINIIIDEASFIRNSRKTNIEVKPRSLLNLKFYLCDKWWKFKTIHFQSNSLRSLQTTKARPRTKRQVKKKN